MLKLSYINRQIKESRKANDALKLAQKLNSLHIEIHSCNRQFWSTHIADSLIQFMLIVNFTCYTILFNTGIILYIRMILMYLAFFWFVIFSLFILIPSFVAYEASKSYRLFYQLYLRLNRKGKLSILKMIKVNHFKSMNEIFAKNQTYVLGCQESNVVIYERQILSSLKLCFCLFSNQFSSLIERTVICLKYFDNNSILKSSQQ